MTFFGITMLLFAMNATAQDPNTKGSKVYIENDSKNENAQKTVAELEEQLAEWGYWKVVNKKSEADLIIDINVTASKGITATSWGGTSFVLVAKVQDKNDKVFWESNAYKASPNGTNGFNAGTAVVKKFIKDLKKKYKDE